MFEAVGSIFSSFSGLFEVNEATLSGAVDVIVVKQPDGTFKSSPFHVRFGKLKILHSREKMVTIYLNGEKTPFQMKLGDAGEAFFEDPLSIDWAFVKSNPKWKEKFINHEKYRSEAEMNEDLSTADRIKSPQLVKQNSKKKSLRAPSDLLKMLNLNKGGNEIWFEVYSTLQGRQIVQAHIYVYDSTTKLVISDIDGTVTKSDVLGHILPLMGNDWAHDGISRLFTNIKKQGYEILYLSARPIGHSSYTKSYLWKINQSGFSLPQGPVVMSPDLMLPSLRREVVFKRPELFKIPTLRDILNLFPQDSKPFFAGFGNRETDAISYRAIGINLHSIFIINPRSEIHQYTGPVALSYVKIDTEIESFIPRLAAITVPAIDENNNVVGKVEVDVVALPPQTVIVVQQDSSVPEDKKLIA